MLKRWHGMPHEFASGGNPPSRRTPPILPRPCGRCNRHRDAKSPRQRGELPPSAVVEWNAFSSPTLAGFALRIARQEDLADACRARTFAHRRGQPADFVQEMGGADEFVDVD